MKKNEVQNQGKNLVDSAVKTVRNMIGECPNPTQEELRKLMAIQGTILNQIGIEILIQNRGEKKNNQKMQMGLKFLAASREALKGSASIRIEAEPLDSDRSQEGDEHVS